MIAFLLALLLWMLGAGPAPAPHGITAPPATSAPATVAPARSVAPAPAVSSAHAAPHPSAAPTVAAPAPITPRPVPGGDCPPHPQMSDDPANAACPADPGGP